LEPTHNCPSVGQEHLTRIFFDGLAHQEQWSELPDRDFPLVYRAIREAEIGPGAYVVEPGCGAGRVSRQLSVAAGPKGWVFAFDLSPKMIARARKERPGDNVSLSINSVTAIPLLDRSMHAAVCYNCFHLFDCPPRSLHELSRVLVSGGRLVIAQSDDLEEFQRSGVLPGSLDQHAATSFSDLLLMLEAFDFRLLKVPKVHHGFLVLAAKKS